MKNKRGYTHTKCIGDLVKIDGALLLRTHHVRHPDGKYKNTLGDDGMLFLIIGIMIYDEGVDVCVTGRQGEIGWINQLLVTKFE
jgi:hypothetical protein